MTDPTDRLKRYGEDIAAAVSPARSRVAALRAIGQARRATARPVRRIAFAALGAVLLSNVVAAGVADAAVPGDTLYPLDRGYEQVAEWFGLGGDHTAERIEEAAALLDRSDPEGALTLVAEAVNEEEVQQAVAALQEIAGSDPDVPAHVEELVEGLHDLAMARRSGETDGVEEARVWVRYLATQIREQARRTDQEQVGPPDHADEPGPPEDVGEERPPGHAGDQGQGPPHQAGERTPATAPGQERPAPDRGGPPPELPTPSGQGQADPPPGTPGGGASSQDRPAPAPAGQDRGGGRP